MSVTRQLGVVRGTVQGVGFRPFLAKLAAGEGLAGHAHNAGGVVHVDVEGPPEAVLRFQSRLAREAPSAARVEGVAWAEAAPIGRVGFEIVASAAADAGALPLPPDLAPCDACLTELRDPGTRRHGYPFTSCASCGPRHSIVHALPYDRERTTMARFPLCADCRREYDDLGDRRHHAQPLACPACGPQLALLDRAGRRVADDALGAAVTALRRGAIVALMGVGGFQLLCDAEREDAVRALRARKRRPVKPFAVLVADLSAARRLAAVSPAEAEALSGPAAPIVLLHGRSGALADGVAPGLARVGVMLPSSPLHALLAARTGPLVCTSGNLHEEPIVIDPVEAREKLGGIAELFLVHDRPIARRVDDAVVHVVAGRARTLRLGRGLGPISLPLKSASPRVCTGGHRKNAPAFALADHVVLWPHVGDLDSVDARAAFEDAVLGAGALLDFTPRELVTDLHPDYATTRWAEAQGLPVRRVPHHAAHVAACLAEHGAGERDALAFAWDGFGLGEDGALWGGETFTVQGGRLEHIGGLRRFPISGGDAAARDGGRALAGLLAEAGVPSPWPSDADRFRALTATRLARPTSSVGRLFDAVAALSGVCTRSTFEGEAAMRLEALAEPGATPYPVLVTRTEIDWRPTLAAMARDLEDVASRFHATLVDAIARTTELHGARLVALGGGVFQNARLTEDVSATLQARGVEVLLPERVPPNDGGLALGQAWLASREDR